MAKGSTLTRTQVYKLALAALPAITKKFPVDSETKLARMMVALVEKESTFKTCVRGFAKTDSGWAWGATQVTSGTQEDIEKIMGWKRRDNNDRDGGARCDPAYSIQLGMAQLAYCLERSGGDWTAALYRYNQGAYAKISKKKSYGHTYSKEVLGIYNRTDFAAVERELSKDELAIVDAGRQEFR